MERDVSGERRIARVVTRVGLHDQPDDVAYWLSRPPAERIEAVEVLRRQVFGYSDVDRPRLQRVCRVLSRA